MSRTLAPLVFFAVLGCARQPAVPLAADEPPVLKPLLSPESPANVRPEPRDATQPPPYYDNVYLNYNGPKPEPIPPLPVRKPVQVLGDLRFYARGGSAPAAASPDGKWLACGGIHLFDAKTGQEAATFHGHDRAVTRMVFSPDSARLYSSESEGTHGFLGKLIVWDVLAKQHMITLPAVDWSLTPDGKLLATLEQVPDNPPRGNGPVLDIARCRPVVRVRDTLTFDEVASFAVNGFRPTAVAISPDGNVLVLGGNDGTVRLWDRQANAELPPLRALTERPADEPQYGQQPAVTRLLFDAAGSRLAGTCGGVHQVNVVREGVVWNWPGGAVARRWKVGDVTAIQFAPDGKHLVTPNAVWSLATGEVVAALNYDTHKRLYSSAAFVPGGDRLYVSGFGMRPGLVEFPSLDPLSITEPPPDDALPKVPFELASPLDMTAMGTARLPDGGLVRALHFPQDQEYGFVHLDAAGQRVRVYESGRIGNLAVTPDGKTLATASRDAGYGTFDYAKWENPIRFWDLRSGKEVGVIRVYPQAHGWMQFSPDGKRLAVLHADGLVRVWDAATRKPLFALDSVGHRAGPLAFSKDGQQLVGGVNPQCPALVVWDVTDSKK